MAKKDNIFQLLKALSILLLLSLSLAGCFKQVSSSLSSSQTSSTVASSEEETWAALSASFISNEVVQVIWNSSGMGDFLVEQVHANSGDLISSFRLSGEYDPQSQVYFCDNYIAYRDAQKGTLSIYDKEGEQLGQWRIDGVSSTRPRVSDDLSKLSDIVEEKQRLLIRSIGEDSILWDSKQFPWFDNFFFFNVHFFSPTEILFFGSNSSHQDYSGIINLDRPEAFPLLIEGNSRITPTSYGAIIAPSMFPNGIRNPQFVHPADHFVLIVGKDGVLTPQYHPVPKELEDAACVFGGLHSSYLGYGMFENEMLTIAVTSPEGELLWFAPLNNESRQYEPYTLQSGSDVSPTGEAILMTIYPHVQIHFRDYSWTLSSPKSK